MKTSYFFSGKEGRPIHRGIFSIHRADAIASSQQAGKKTALFHRLSRLTGQIS